MVFIRLTPAQSTGIHGWGPRLKTTLNWQDIVENEDIDFDALLRVDLAPRDLRRLQEDPMLWVRHAGCRAHHAIHMLPWPAHPIEHLGGDLSDLIGLRATGKQLRAMGVTYAHLCNIGMTPETMRLMGLTFQGWVDLGLTQADTAQHFTDAQLSRVFQMTRTAVNASFRTVVVTRTPAYA
jgi:hypothetical protein